MFKRKKQLITTLVILALWLTSLISLLLPCTAIAGSNYSVIRTETVSGINTYLTYPIIQVDIPNTDALSANDVVTVSLPFGLEMDNTPDPSAGVWDSPRVTYSSAATEAAKTAGFETAMDSTGAYSANGVTYNGGGGIAPNNKANVKVYAPAAVGNTGNAFNVDHSTDKVWQAYGVGKSFIEIKVINPALFKAGTTNGRLYIYLQSVKVTAPFSGDIKAELSAPSNSGFSNGSVTVAKWSEKGVVVSANSITSMGTASTAMDVIIIQETTKNSLVNGDVVRFKLPPGFKWSAVGTAIATWGFNGLVFNTAIDAGDSSGRTLKITCPPVGLGSLSSEGRIYLSGTAVSVDDETIARTGDVSVNVTGNYVNSQDIIIAHYTDYNVTVEEKTITSVVAGWDDTELGAFSINESIAGSLIPGRTVTLSLPSGVKWDDTNYVVGPAANLTTVFQVSVNSGIDWARSAGATATLDDSKRVLKIVLQPGSFARSRIDIKALKVKISPDYIGDIIVDVGGTAGAQGRVRAATVQAPITINTAPPVNLFPGKQDQAVGNIEITEVKKDTIKAGANIIQLDLPAGVRFSGVPAITVTEGDIHAANISTLYGNRSIQLSFKNTSTIASRIRLSNIKLTVDRTVPDGAINLMVNAMASTALTNQANTFNVVKVGEVVIGQCVTPPPQGIAGYFRIDSNIYGLSGIPRVMDAVPYIYNGRSYVPVRYLGYVLGMSDSDIAWDGAKRKVTMSKGDQRLELTIGSHIMMVNGEPESIEVPPQISNGRTMLPARFVAETMGYLVTWEGADRTVTVLASTGS